MVLKLSVFGEWKRLIESQSEVENVKKFWDFDYETTYETKQKKSQVDYLELSCNRINN